MPRSVVEHRRAAGELLRLPPDVRDTFALVRAALADPATPMPAYREQIVCRRQPRRVLHIASALHRRVHYRMAWEVRGERVLVWMYGAHEGFYARLGRRAGCDCL